MISIVFFNGTFVNNDSIWKDAKVSSSLILPNNIEVILVGASKGYSYSFCANRFNNDNKIFF